MLSSTPWFMSRGRSGTHIRPLSCPTASPATKKNLDLAQEIRRAGWDVLYFNYRGSWGSPGDFSFSHGGIEDTAAAIAYLRKANRLKRSCGSTRRGLS